VQDARDVIGPVSERGDSLHSQTPDWRWCMNTERCLDCGLTWDVCLCGIPDHELQNVGLEEYVYMLPDEDAAELLTW